MHSLNEIADLVFSEDRQVIVLYLQESPYAKAHKG